MRRGAAAITTCLALAACGGSEELTQGGTAKVTQTTPMVSLDPALAEPQGDWSPIDLVYTPLLTYRHADGEEGTTLIAGLARELPQVSADGMSYRLELRDGLEYSDGTPVVASDFEHTIKRVLILGSPGADLYRAISGAGDYAVGDDPGFDIPGIEADDETGTIRITLTGARSDFQHALAARYSGLVGEDTPFRDMSEAPPAGVGPYELAAGEAGGEFTLKRSQAFDDADIPDIPTGNLARIVAGVEPDLRTQAESVLESEVDFMTERPPAKLLPTVREQASDRFTESSAASTDYFFLNARTAPFDDPWVREAVNRGIDRSRLARLYEGGLTAGCSLLAPGIPGYDPALDGIDCPYGEPGAPPDVNRARDLVRRAGARGARVVVWGTDAVPLDRVSAAYARQLTAIGLRAETRLLPPPAYAELVGDGLGDLQTGLLRREQELAHPLAFLVGAGASSRPSDVDTGLAGLDDPELDAELDRLRLEPETATVTEDWAALNRYLVAPPRSYVAPLGHRLLSTFMSERLDFAACALVHPVFLNDPSSWCLKEGEQ